MDRIDKLYEQLVKIITPNTVFACIGARPTSSYVDSVGPQIGLNLINYQIPNVYGTIDKPIDAITAERYISYIKRKHKNEPVIAIDIAITKDINKYGKIQISAGGIYPGAALKKNISRIGDYNIKAYVLQANNKDILMNSVLYESANKDIIIQLVEETVTVISEAIIIAYYDRRESEDNSGPIYRLI